MAKVCRRPPGLRPSGSFADKIGRHGQFLSWADLVFVLWGGFADNFGTSWPKFVVGLLASALRAASLTKLAVMANFCRFPRG
ncbi:MAG: hypothetical protein HYV97_07765 [Bdellovibrio sp.]|nr:hypothetical protein [Bdellovibrio sp.]